MTTAAGSPDWTTSAAPLTGTGSPKTVAYTTTGRKDVVLASDITTNYSAQTFSNTVATGNVTDNCGGQINNTITASGYVGNVATSGIVVRITASNHTWSNDLSYFLVAPNGTTILGLTNNRGNGAGCSWSNVGFSDSYAGVMGAACPGAGSNWKPETATYTDCAVTSNVTSFGAIGGGSMNPNGNWTLRIVDNVSGDVGAAIAISGWNISFPAYSTTSSGTNTYTGFNNTITAAPAAGSILASLTSGCPGTYYFASSLGSTPGFTYTWSTPGLPAGVTANIASSTSTGTNITFTNSNATNQSVTVRLTVSSKCCGALAPIDITFTVDALPAVPTASATGSPICPGGCATLNATLPAGASFEWYDAASGGSLLTSGATYVVCPASTTNYYVQSINANGCISATRFTLPVTVTATTPPTAKPCFTMFSR